MSLFQNLIAQSGPPIPPSFDVMHFATGASNPRAQVATRQVTLEPSVAGADRARSWSCWVHQSNIGTWGPRIFGVQMTASGNQQYVFSVTGQDPATDNQLGRFVIFTDASNFIKIDTSQRFLRNRWIYVVVTYDGSETAAGLKIYLNSVEDTSAAKSMTGTYTGARNDANNRFIISRYDSPSTKYGGDIRDLAIWNRVLTQSEVTELWNGGEILPSVSTVSFYADIVAYWPMQTNTNCLNSATFNFTNVTAITTRSVPMSPFYKQISFFNCYPGNTSYIAFGSMYDIDKLSIRIGTNHIEDGVINKIVLNKNNLTVGAAVPVISDPTYDLRTGQAVFMAGGVTIFSTRNVGDPVDLVDIGRYASTDGVVGETFGAITTMPVTQDWGLFYGKPVKVGDEFFIPEYEFTAAGTYELNVFKRDSGGTYTKIPVWSGAEADGYTEWSLLYVGGTTFIGMSRSNTKNGLWYLVSNDMCATWSAPVTSGLGTGTCMADMCLDARGRIVLVFGDRGTSYLVASTGNRVSDILADPTDWVPISNILQSYSTDPRGILGYPTIYSDGFNFSIFVSLEHSGGTRADLYAAHGLFGWGV